MATTSFATGNDLTAKQYAVGLDAEVLKMISFRDFMGPDSRYLIQVRDELNKGPGDQVYFGLRMQLSGAPKVNDETLTGNERSLTIHSDSVSLFLARDAVEWDRIMSQQRTNFDLREEAKAGLADLIAGQLDTSFFNQLAGYTPETELGLTGGAAPNSISSTHQLWTESGTTADEDLDSAGDDFTLTMIDQAVEVAETSTPAIRPAWIPSLGQSLYVCFIHPYQRTSLRGTSSRWTAIFDNAMQGGQIDENPILTGRLGIYNNTLIVSSNRVPLGVNSGDSTASVANTRRAIFCGAQSVIMAHGRPEFGMPERYEWIEESKDYKKVSSVAAQLVYAMKRPRFNSADVNSIVISSYAAAS